ncbi:hypothetical protein [Albimonas pacifica]|uniref:Uncharacterized protein n=1 Tax=Albimonas pacifica TaxID=1114924 RepID=A0A1I3HJZ0_9RHOB|nr:hypothetical protein [Albimonas pacifica]SFI35981.1 hypothetical protein SAMN05216258_10636 [Albimonas pacifica]
MTDDDIAWIGVRGAVISFFDGLPDTIRGLVLTSVALSAIGPENAGRYDPASSIDVWIGADRRLCRLRLIIVCALIDEVLRPASDLDRIATEIMVESSNQGSLAAWEAGASLRRRHLAQARLRWACFRSADLSPMALHRLPALPSS